MTDKQHSVVRCLWPVWLCLVCIRW